MKSSALTVCVVSQASDVGLHCKSVVDAVCCNPSEVALTASEAIAASRNKGDRLLLVDRSLPDGDLVTLAAHTDRVNIATFGAGRVNSDALVGIELISRYQLRHPVEHKDIERLLSCLKKPQSSASSQSSSRSSHLYRGLVGSSASVRQLRDLIRKISRSRSNVLISGETGSGKEVVARNIHYQSPQGDGPFVAVNCAAIPPDLLESELFGHKKGAFSGALTNRDGRFAMAAGGTLFLDEIGDMSPALQVKLLRVLEERVIYRVGCNKSIEMTARLIAATHRNLEERIVGGSFREDLYYRLNVVPVEVPALREREEDIPELVRELSCRLQREQGVTIELSKNAVRCLREYSWPGNVREVANLIERLAVINPNGSAGVADLPKRYRSSLSVQAGVSNDGLTVLNHKLVPDPLPADGIDLRRYLRTTETDLIRQALDLSGGTVSRAASLLNVGRTTLCEKVKRLGLANLVKADGRAQ